MIKVLIVEDDPAVAKMNSLYLEKIKGFTLHSIAVDCIEALQILRNNKIDLVLVDIFLPGMNGLEMLAKIRQEGPGADVIMITAARDMDSVKRALQLGAVDYLIKPVALERFAVALKQYANRFIAMQDSVLNQRNLDEQFLERSLPNCLPKGLEKQTMKVVEAAVQEFKKPFTIEELVVVTGISRVTLRKYLEYMISIGEMSVEQIYGTIGRPVSKYIFIEKTF